MAGYAEFETILDDARLDVWGEQIRLFAPGFVVNVLDASFPIFKPPLGPKSAGDPIMRANFVRVLGDAMAAGVAQGALHKSTGLHKGLHKRLHKGLHKGLHKTLATTLPPGTATLAWPEIGVPWRELGRLHALRDAYRWDDMPIELPPTAKQLLSEIPLLRKRQEDLRAPDNAWRRARIEIEATNDLTAYMLPLGTDETAPATDTAILFQTILWLGHHIGLIYKARFEVPRPHVLDPSLEPAIPVPAYSAYPSNHAFQSFLIAEIFARAVPEHPGLRALFRAAQQVAENREWAGLHYRFDTIAGRQLARFCAPVFERVLTRQIRRVRMEWS